jgi:hypothetical protein
MIPGMRFHRIVLLVLASLLAVAEAVALVRHAPSKTVILAREAASAPVSTPAIGEGSFGLFEATMTPDDVARGLWALGDSGPGLTDAQRQALAPEIGRARELHARIAGLRGRRRAEQDRWLDDGAVLVDALGVNRVGSLTGKGQP